METFFPKRYIFFISAVTDLSRRDVEQSFTGYRTRHKNSPQVPIYLPSLGAERKPVFETWFVSLWPLGWALGSGFRMLEVKIVP